MNETHADRAESESRPLREQVTEALTGQTLAPTEKLLVEELTRSFDTNKKKILSKINGYKILGWITLIAIPIISTLIAFLVNLPESEKKGTDPQTLLSYLEIPYWVIGTVISFLSIILAVLSVLNNIFKPADRFRRACLIGVKFFYWRCSFLKGLGDCFQSGNKPLSKYLEEQLAEFKKLQEADIDIGLPEEK